MQHSSLSMQDHAVPAAPLPAERAITLFGLDIMDTSIEQAAKWLVTRAQHRQSTQVSFLNADCVNIMHSNPTYRDALARSDRIFADGIGVRIAAKLAGHSLQDNVNGTDLFPVLCRQAAAGNVGVFLFGARPGRAKSSGEAMQRANPGLIVSGSHHGYIDGPDQEARVIDEINASGAEILLVALGAPNQELWIARNRHRLRPAVVLGVGGLFDYYSGSVARAPITVRKFRMEWLWRLAMEPRRLARRYIIGNVEFLIRVGLAAASHSATQPAKSA
jgi:exopolysaccharide biosynthesis WecB/TagA/CpsF family protein